MAYGGSQARGRIGAVQAASATYTTAHGNAGSLTHLARPGIKPATSWFLVGFINHCATMGTPCNSYFFWTSSLSFHSAVGPANQGTHPVQIWFFCLFVSLFRAACVAYGGSQARGPMRAIATSLHHRHSNTGSEPRLWPTPQLTAISYLPTEQGQGLNPHPHGYLFVNHWAMIGTLVFVLFF